VAAATHGGADARFVAGNGLNPPRQIRVRYFPPADPVRVAGGVALTEVFSSLFQGGPLCSSFVSRVKFAFRVTRSVFRLSRLTCPTTAVQCELKSDTIPVWFKRWIAQRMVADLPTEPR